jgi:hypothetical protein
MFRTRRLASLAKTARSPTFSLERRSASRPTSRSQSTMVGAPLRKKVTSLDVQKLRNDKRPITMVRNLFKLGIG